MTFPGALGRPLHRSAARQRTSIHDYPAHKARRLMGETAGKSEYSRPIANSWRLTLRMLCTAPGSWQVDRHALDWKELRARDGLINSTACPRFITRNDRYSSPEAQRIGCCFKPAQQRLLTTRRYATCDNTTLGARDLLRALGPRRLALVGDSVTHQIWHALSVSLFESGEAVRITTRRRNEALQPRNFVADDVCSIKGSAAHGGSELNLSFTPVPACVNGICRAACGERRPDGATAHHPGLLGLIRQGSGCAARPAGRATEPRRAQ